MTKADIMYNYYKVDFYTLRTNPTIQYTPQQWKEILLDDKLWNNTETKND